MAEHTFFYITWLFSGTILLIFGMRYFAITVQAKTKIASDEAYRQVAEKAVAAQAEIAAALSDIKARLAVVETILKAVD